MICLLRVDDKLLHGQVAFSWVKNLRIHTIIIADDEVVYDGFMKMTLGLSKPSEVHLEIVEVSKAIELIRQHIHSDLNVMIVVKNIENAYRILEKVPQIQSLNLGSLRTRYGVKQITENIALNDKELQLCQKLINHGTNIEIRMCYHDKKQDFGDFFK